MLDTIRNNVADRTSITPDEAGWLFTSAPDGALRELATAVKARFNPVDEATWLMMAIVNYTNVCVARCDYCSFYRFPGESGTYLLSTDQVCDRIDALVAHGGQLVGFNGGFHPDLRVSDYTDLFAEVRRRYPALAFYEMTVAEFMFVTKRTGLTFAESARRFAAAGTRWITGGGAEILTDSFRMRHSPGKYKVEDYYSAQRAILDAGMGSTATMVIGFDESLDERLAHLDRLRRFQAETGARMPSFLCWTYKPWNNDLGGDEIDTAEYLRWLAVSRIFLDNVPHIRASVLTQNERALEGLLYGADDFDLPTEDEVTQKAGAVVTHDFDRVLASVPPGVRLVRRDPWPTWSEVAHAAK
jgi:cyclic dehypoxanthinyl futalosine synthase